MELGRISILTAFFLGLMAPCASALSVSPGRTDIRLAPGKKINSELTVLNDSAEDLQVDAGQKNWFLYEANKNTVATDWIKIHGKTHFLLKPGASRKIPVTVICPKKAEGVLVGMASFIFRTDHPGTVTPMISVSIYLTAAGTERLNGEIRKLTARFWKHALTVGAEVAATGNVHLRPSGSLVIFDEKGAQVAQYVVPQKDPVYPGQTRGFIGAHQSNETAPLPLGGYVLKAHLVSGDLQMDAEKKFQVFAGDKIQMEGETAPS
jgi:hypothetical protein